MRHLLITAAVVLALSAQANAAAVRLGFDSNSLPANDDNSTGLVDIGFGISFYGLDFTQLYVNNNGNVTFDDRMLTYTPFALNSTSRHIIAPFFADVDTRYGGTVTYGSGSVDGRSAFGVTWNTVAGYGLSTQLRNTFQLVMLDRSDRGAGQFDFEFNYDSVQWDTGTASDGVAARVGYSNGTLADGTFYEMDGSATQGAFFDSAPSALIKGRLNSNVDGRYLFTVGAGGQVDPNPQPATVPLPASAPLLLAGAALLAALRRRPRA